MTQQVRLECAIGGPVTQQVQLKWPSLGKSSGASSIASPESELEIGRHWQHQLVMVVTALEAAKEKWEQRRKGGWRG